MPAWLIIGICVADYLAMVLATGWILSYARGKRRYFGIDRDDVVFLSILWPFGIWVVTGPFWKNFFRPFARLWDSAYDYGNNYEQRKRARAARREEKREEKRAEQELQREFVDLCKQNGWNPKQVLKHQKKVAA